MAEALGQAILELSVDEKPLIAGLADAKRRIDTFVATEQALLDRLHTDISARVDALERSVAGVQTKAQEAASVREIVREVVRETPGSSQPSGAAEEPHIWGVRGPQHPGSLTNPITVVIEAGKYQPMGAMAAAVGDQAQSAQGGAPTAASEGPATSQDVQNLSESIDDLVAATQPGPARPTGQGQVDINSLQNQVLQRLVAETNSPVAAEALMRAARALEAVAPRLGAPGTPASGTGTEGPGTVVYNMPSGSRTTINEQGGTTVYSAPGGGPMSPVTPGSQITKRVDVYYHASGEGGGGGGGLAGASGDGGDGGGIPWQRLLWGTGMFGMAGIGTLGSLAGFDFLHAITVALSLMGSAAAGAAGGFTLLAGAAGKFAVGMGSDLAVMSSTIADTQTLYTAYQNVQNAILQYGAGSRQAAAAQAQLNLQMKELGDTAGVKAELGLAKATSALDTYWDKATSQARVQAVNILMQVVQLAHTYVPLVAQAATENLSIINQDIKPLFAWLQGPGGIGIFKQLEAQFAAQLPTAIDAFTQATQFSLRFISLAANYTGGFVTALDKLFTRLNSMSDLQINAVIGRLVTDFRVWLQFIEMLGKDIYDIFRLDAGTGNSIINTLTGMLEKLHEWLQTTQGQADVRNIFVVHKEEIDALLHVLPQLFTVFGQFYITVAPPLVRAVTWVAQAFANVVKWLDQLGPGGKVTGTALAGFTLLGLKLGWFKTAVTGIIGELGKMILSWGPLLSVLQKIPLIGSAVTNLLNKFQGVQNVAEMNVAEMNVGAEAGGKGIGVSPGVGTSAEQTAESTAEKDATTAGEAGGAGFFASLLQRFGITGGAGGLLGFLANPVTVAVAAPIAAIVAGIVESQGGPYRNPNTLDRGARVLPPVNPQVAIDQRAARQADQMVNATTQAILKGETSVQKGLAAMALDLAQGVRRGTISATQAYDLMFKTLDTLRARDMISATAYLRSVDQLTLSYTQRTAGQALSEWENYDKHLASLRDNDQLSSRRYLQETQNAFLSFTGKIVNTVSNSYQNLFNGLDRMYSAHKISTQQLQTQVAQIWKQGSSTITSEINQAKQAQEAIWLKQAQDGKITWSQYWSNVHQLNVSAGQQTHNDMAAWAAQIYDAMAASGKVTFSGAQAIWAELKSLIGPMGGEVPPHPTSVGVVHQSINPYTSAGTGAHAAGGLVQVGQPGEAGRDTVPVSFTVAPGEQIAVFNRHQLPVVNAALAMAGYGGLGGLFSAINTPNYMSPGGYAAGGYVYPYPPGTVMGRTDMGVDTAVPTGAPIGAVGPGTIMNTSIGGWPGGPMMYWQLDSGPDAGRYIYLGEMIRPVVTAGQHVSANQAVAMSTGPSQEMGWAVAGGRTLAQAQGFSGFPTAAGLAYRAFLSALSHGRILGGLGLASITAPHVEGPPGTLTSLVQRGLDRAAAAANAYAQRQMAKMSPGAGSFNPASLPAATGPVMQQIDATLKPRGWSPVSVAAAIGNAAQESTLNPGAIGSGGGGLWGFTAPPTSLADLQEAAQAAGVPWTSVPFQSAFMASHYGDLAALNAYRDPSLAAAYFMNTFEHPYAPDANLSNREAWARRAYAEGYARGGLVPGPRHHRIGGGGGGVDPKLEDFIRDVSPHFPPKDLGHHWLRWLDRHVDFTPLKPRTLTEHYLTDLTGWLKTKILGQDGIVARLSDKEQQLANLWGIKSGGPTERQQDHLVNLDRAIVAWLLRGVFSTEMVIGDRKHPGLEPWKRSPLMRLIHDLEKGNPPPGWPKPTKAQISKFKHFRGALEGDLTNLIGISGITGQLGQAEYNLMQLLNQGGAGGNKAQQLVQLLQQRDQNLEEKLYLMREQYWVLMNELRALEGLPPLPPPPMPKGHQNQLTGLGHHHLNRLTGLGHHHRHRSRLGGGPGPHHRVKALLDPSLWGSNPLQAFGQLQALGPGWVTGGSQAPFQVLATLPAFGGSFAKGGVVPGALGEPRTIIAHGGETVSNGSPTVNVNFKPGTEWLAKFVQVEIERHDRKTARRGRSANPSRGGGRLVFS